jgi:hypothetical protein
MRPSRTTQLFTTYWTGRRLPPTGVNPSPQVQHGFPADLTNAFTDVLKTFSSGIVFCGAVHGARHSAGRRHAKHRVLHQLQRERGLPKLSAAENDAKKKIQEPGRPEDRSCPGGSVNPHVLQTSTPASSVTPSPTVSTTAATNTTTTTTSNTEADSYKYTVRNIPPQFSTQGHLGQPN